MDEDKTNAEVAEEQVADAEVQPEAAQTPAEEAEVATNPDVESGEPATE